VLLAGVTGAAPAANAAILSIPAVGFTQLCDPSCSTDPPILDRGVLKPTAFTRLYAAVDFPTNDQRFCALSIIYQDINNNNDSIKAELFRKAAKVGGNTFKDPVLIGVVESDAGVVNRAQVHGRTSV
jgi:hypothetical protein